MLVTAGLDGTRLRDMDTGQTRSIPTGAVMASVFSPDSRTLAAAGVDGTVQVWDVATGQVRGTLPGSSGHVLSVVFSRTVTPWSPPASTVRSACGTWPPGRPEAS